MLSEEVEKELLAKVGKEATEATKTALKEAEKQLEEKHLAVVKGLMTEKAFNDFKQEAMEPINKTLQTLEAATKAQGEKMNAMLEKAAPGSKTIEDFVIGQKDKIKELRANGKFMEITAAELKAAGVYSVASTIPTPSPYAPGIGGADLDIFEIIRNPNFITSKVDLGRTNQSRLAWANELSYEGTPTIVAEGGLKPQLQHKFAIETSVAKKIAGWIELTDEYEQDLPQFATKTRRMLQTDVERAFDDAIQTDVMAVARPFEITQLNGKIQDANYWDALLAMLGQIGYNNYIPNTVGINWLTNVMLNGEKNANGTYLLPPFVNDINSLKVYANKLAVDYGLVGDLTQYKVDIYKDFVLKIGWINDELIYNKFAIVGEMRYHSYISDARKKAIVYDNLQTVDAAITSNP